MAKYEFDTERWLRTNAELYRRKGNQQMARNFEMCAEDVHMLKTALRAKDADYVALRARVAKLEEALGNIVEYWNKDENEAAMADACWHNVETARRALEEK